MFAACVYGRSAPEESLVNATLRRAVAGAAIDVSDAMEALIADGLDTTEDREYAYYHIAKRETVTAADAFARAVAAGRIAQLRGLNSGKLVQEAEAYARLSRRFDPEFRGGAAQRMLGTLYVVAPASMLRHGDSEIGLELLEELLERHPGDIRNHLRLAEAYVSLGDEDPAREHICYCLARQTQLRPDELYLLRALVEDIGHEDC